MAKYLCIWVRAYWFLVTSFFKWLPGGHYRFFGFWMAWFRQRNSSVLWNLGFNFHVHVLCGCRQKANDCQLYCFQNSCLVILPPSPMGGGILVDHWSTIFSVCSVSVSQGIHFSTYSFILRGNGMDQNVIEFIWLFQPEICSTCSFYLFIWFRILEFMFLYVCVMIYNCLNKCTC